MPPGARGGQRQRMAGSYWSISQYEPPGAHGMGHRCYIQPYGQHMACIYLRQTVPNSVFEVLTLI
jgi:hypothetical protein